MDNINIGQGCRFHNIPKDNHDTKPALKTTTDCTCDECTGALADITSDKAANYLPNMKILSPEQKFDLQLSSGVKLADGSTLLRPIMLNTGSTKIVPTKDGQYDVIFTSFVGGYKHEPSVRTLSEENLLNDKGLTAGTVKELDDGTYEVTYYTEPNFKDYSQTTEILTKQELMDLMQEKCIYM